MTTSNTTGTVSASTAARKLSRLNTLTEFVEKVDVAILGEEPQMRKELQRVRKLAIDEMRTLRIELDKIAHQKNENMV